MEAIVSGSRPAAEEATRLLRALADPDRLLVLCELAQGERSTDELQRALGIEPLAVSQHLNVLRNLELVTTRARSKRLYYAVRDPRVLGVLLSLYRLFCAPVRESPAGPA
jgi:DNA-binding transcriptional ArsR family regulator